MINSLIHTRFNFLPVLSEQDTKIEIQRVDIPQVPMVGQTISIEGNPFIVQDVGWALGRKGEADEGQLYAYVTVLKASNFRLKLGGRTY